MKRILFLAGFLISVQLVSAQECDESLKQLEKDFNLFQLKSCVQEVPMKECTVYNRLSDNIPVCINDDYEPEFIRDEDGITRILLYEQDTLVESIEEGYSVTYSEEGVIERVEYGYGDYPEGMYSTYANYQFANGELVQYIEKSTATNYWVPPDSCCPFTEKNLEYYFREGEFVEGIESFEDSEDEESSYSGSIDALSDEEAYRIRQSLEFIDSIEIIN